ncbi:MAG: LysM peptidoglycan-binding domain-containing protein [Leptolinea sp.]|jgi:LysM repeat protein|nr:LysM peptidoglycan-binding domain-containing protein [Leptolinea sp.]
MKKSPIPIICLLLHSLLILFTTGFFYQVEGADFTAVDMISAVNNLRSAKGLAPVQMNSTLMAVAQNHSAYQAATHKSSHAGSAGEIVTARVTASGYGGGKKIAAGENIASLSLGMTGMLGIIMNEIWADPVHGGAMINPKYTDVGVGIASDSETVYITLNLAGVVDDTGASGNQPATPGVVIANPNKLNILPLFTCTPFPDGTVYHTVGYGQTLRTIAQIYEVKVDDLARINQIDPDKIYEGQKLWIKKMEMPTITATLVSTPSSTIAISATPLISTRTTEPVSTATPVKPADLTVYINTREVGILVIFILFIGVLGYFLFAGSRSDRRI